MRALPVPNPTHSSSLQIISIVQARVDTFLKDIFDICKSYEDIPTTNTRTIATETAICDAVEVAIRRRRNERILFGHLPTDIVHSIFEIVLDVDRVHDPDFPLERLNSHRRQLFRMRRASSSWNNLLLSSPRYWQVINITSPPHAITAAMERSGSTSLCVYCPDGSRQVPPKHSALEKLRSCGRFRTVRSEHPGAYRLYRWLLQDHVAAVRTLQLIGSPSSEDPIEPLGDLTSIRYLDAQGWKPPSDAAWLVGLKELVLNSSSQHDTELLRVISACANVERLVIVGREMMVASGVPSAVSPVTLPRLTSMRLSCKVNESAITLIRALVTPQCLRRVLIIGLASRLGLCVEDYRTFMSLEENCAPTQYPQSASVSIKGSRQETYLEYSTKTRQFNLGFLGTEDVPAFHDLVQGIQGLLKEPSIKLTIADPCGPKWPFLKSFGDQNIRTIVAHFRYYYPKAEQYSGGGIACAYRSLEDVNYLATEDLMKAIGADSKYTLFDGSSVDTTAYRPFKSLRSIEIHQAYVNLDDFTRLVEKYLQNSKPLLEEIVLVDCRFRGMQSTQAAERLAGVGINLRCVGSEAVVFSGRLSLGAAY